MSSTATSTSTQDVLTAIISNGVVCAVFVTLFFILRLRFKRVYEPKTCPDLLPEEDQPPKLPPSPIDWFRALYDLWQCPHLIIKYTGIDGYLFLRYLLLISSFGFGGIFIWIILFPVNATGGNGETGLNQLSISNCNNVGRYYAHVFVSWIYFGAIIFSIYRELLFYGNLKILVQSTPYMATKLSSRTVIFQTVPDQYLNEHEFKKLFEGVKNIWVAKVSSKLIKTVNKRDSLIQTLENNLNSILIKCVSKFKKNPDEFDNNLRDEIVSYIPQKKMPTIKETKFIGKKHDLIDYCIENLPKLNKEINELQNNKNNSLKPLNTITVEFENQYYAQLAYQVIVHDQPLHFNPKHIGVEPSDIFWPNMRLFWWEQLSRLAGSIALIVFLIIIWAIPVAFVGFISNLTYLTNKMHWLRFIYHLPKVLLGLITSLLPSVALAVLMMLLPIFIRTMGKLSGCVTNQQIEYFTQQSYFAFQVVQTFLVITISSSVSTVVTQIIEEPTSALSLLSNNLPKSSNFFISYIILNGFSVAGGTLFQIVAFILFYVFSFMDKTVRSKYNRYNSIGGQLWGTLYPGYEVLATISIAYSIISPIILLFTFVSFLFLFITYLNTLNYVNGIGIEMMGKSYPRAIFHLFVGLYLGEICLIGLFAVSKSWGCIVLEAIFTGFTVLAHVQMNLAYDKLLTVLPNTCMKPLDGESNTVSWDNGLNEKEDTDRLIEEPLLIEGDRTELNKPNKLIQFFQPWKYLTYHDLRMYIPKEYYSIDESIGRYDCPFLDDKMQVIWIPRDEMGISKKIIEQFKGIIEISDENASFNEKGKIIWTGSPPVSSSNNIEDKIEKEEKEDGDDTFAVVDNDDDVKKHFDSF